MSIRAWIAVLLTCTVCCMSAVGMKVQEPLYTLVGMALGWYFGQKEKPAVVPTRPKQGAE